MTHGLTLIETASGPRRVSPPSLAIIGLVATAGAVGADAIAALDAAFPLNTPVLVTNIETARGAAGTTGTLGPALAAIADQTTPFVVVVRVAVATGDADDPTQDELVVGSTAGNVYTGAQALLAAESVVGVRPRIIGAPGLDTQAVTTALVTIAKKLRGRVYARAIGADAAAVLLYREQFSARELTLIWPDTSATFAGDVIARALGLRARIDEEQGWHKTLSNVAMDGVTGLTRDVHFDLLDPSTEAGLLNEGGIVTLIRTNGYRFWGNITCADETQPDFMFESAVRTLHALQDIVAEVVQPFLDLPMTVGLIKDLLETGNAAFRQQVNDGRLIGAELFFDKDANTPAQLAAGRPTFRIQYTPCAPLENPRVQLVITDFYYTGFADQLL
ncbi:phage tail sheath subtilisin-like domain-containing protein [Sphingomonas psychrotolerans]|uniref:Phage tail sheath subtilisin-like domain-containing protein n=1 Tax=Sphingomonas psychrotolerans TaxID=1327635 RepID=A0ABU3N116_9SPHN|nr:phage tail sheath subtilisin-like domain-containing protein [Sphingomonas psychrotolerans]MDT8758248.1 phage tail sheath subtilisin-like domain-containing protein [Sphingomonas psychrotolerans]